MQKTIRWCQAASTEWDRLPKRVIAVVQATVTHILSCVPVIPKYGVALPAADLITGFELNIGGE